MSEPAATAATKGASPPATSAARPSVIQLVFREKGALYAAFMPMFSEGGIFVPTTRDYKLGEDIYLLLSLPDDRRPLPGRRKEPRPARPDRGNARHLAVVGQAHADDLSGADFLRAAHGDCRDQPCTSIRTAT